MVDVYVAGPVAAVRALYGDLVGRSAWTRAPVDQLRVQADRLADGHRLRIPGSDVELANWHPMLVTRPVAEIWAADLREDDFLLALARQHGYRQWESVPAGPGPVPEFEAAVEAVVDGDLVGLTRLLDATPDLVSMRSHWGHRATLLHYVAANGVETYRQRVSPSAADVASLLVSRGAEVHATADMYGGRQTALALLLTSSHPRDAGVTAAVAHVLGVN
jgi:hypothetical protein